MISLYYKIYGIFFFVYLSDVNTSNSETNNYWLNDPKYWHCKYFNSKRDFIWVLSYLIYHCMTYIRILFAIFHNRLPKLLTLMYCQSICINYTIYHSLIKLYRMWAITINRYKRPLWKYQIISHNFKKKY